ncbi:MAG: hypothetical protein ACLQD9_04875 [Thermoplasmata archaeon]
MSDVTDYISNGIILPELHLTIGAGVVFGAYLLLQGLPPYRTSPSGERVSRVAWNLVAVGLFVFLDFLKELLWDPVNEANNPFLWAGVMDLGWYAVGILGALGLIYTRFRKL